jgi:transcriptional regulator with XRE-family HTH domain
MAKKVDKCQYARHKLRIMKIAKNIPDAPILAELGQKLMHARLDKNLTQAQLAEQAGISKRTLERLEAGGSSQLMAFVRVCRALGFLERLTTVIPETPPSPMAQIKLHGRQRKRASGKRAKQPPPAAIKQRPVQYEIKDDINPAFFVGESPPSWKWGDEK